LLTLTGHGVEHRVVERAAKLIRGVEPTALIAKHAARPLTAHVGLPAQIAYPLRGAADHLPRIAVVSYKPFGAGDLPGNIHLLGHAGPGRAAPGRLGRLDPTGREDRHDSGQRCREETMPIADHASTPLPSAFIRGKPPPA
jgi:hypothetical protein